MEPSQTFESYLKELWRHRFRIVGITFAVAVLTAIVSLVIPKTYEATVLLHVQPPGYKPELASKTPEVQTCQFLLTSPRVLALLQRRLVGGRAILNELTAGEPIDELWLSGLRDLTTYTMVRKVSEQTTPAMVAEKVDLTTFTIIQKTANMEEPPKFLEDAVEFVAGLDDVGLTGLDDFKLKDLKDMTLEDLAESLNAVITEEKKTAIETIFSPIIVLRARGRTGAQAAMLANAWSATFLEVYGGLVRTGLVGSHKFISSEVERFEKERVVHQEKITRLRGEFDMEFLAARIEGATENAQELEKELTRKRLDLDYETSRLLSLDRTLYATEDDGVWVGATTASVTATKSGVTGRELAMRSEILASADRLRRARSDLTTFRTQNDMEALTRQRERALYDLVDFESQLNHETLNVDGTAESLEAIVGRLGATSPTLRLSRRYSTGTVWIEAPNPAWQELEYKRAELEAELARAKAAKTRLVPYLDSLKTTLGATSIRFNRLESKHTQLQRDLEFAQEEHDGYRQAHIQLKRDRYDAAQAIGPLRAQVGQLEAAVENVQAMINDTQTSLTKGQAKLAFLQVEDQTIEQYLTQTLENLQEARLAVAQQGLDVKVASEAIAPSRKIWPQRTLMVLVMTFLGFFFTVAAFCGRHYLVSAGVWSAD